MAATPVDGTMEIMTTSDLHVRSEGAVGRITLCRPRLLNALSHEMVLALERTLLDWQERDEVALILVDAVGDKAFCAGGDVTALYRQGTSGDVESGRQFWRDEYRLNALIDRYPKPYVVIMDGIVMGGGIGISAHGSHRVVTERSSLALPECSIGLIPDVGATHLLSRSPGFVGEYLALTGERFGPGDAIFAGFADHFVPMERIAAMQQALIESGRVELIADFCVAPESSDIADNASFLDTAFGAAVLPDVLAFIGNSEHPWLEQAAKKIARASPLSLQLAFDLVRESRQVPGLEKALIREFRFVSRAVEDADFLEGIRAALIDRDKAPAWRYAAVSDVPIDLVTRFRDEAPGGDVRFDGMTGGQA